MAVSTLDESVRYRSLVDRLGAIVWEATPGRASGTATFTFVSEHTESLLGYPAARWMADDHFWSEIVHPDDRDLVDRAIVDVVRTGSGDFEYRAHAADGREVWLRNIAQVDPTAPDLRLTGVLTDITARKAAEARLVRLQDLTDALAGTRDAGEAARVIATTGRAAVGATAAAVFLLAGEGLELAGYDGPSGGVSGDEGLAADAVRSREVVVLDAEALVALPLIGGDRVLGAVALRLPPGRSVGQADRLVLDVLGRTSVSALERAEQIAAEQDSRALLDAVITTAPEGFALFDCDLRYVRVNDALAAINGVPAADHVGRTLEEVVPDVPAEGHTIPLRRVLETGEPIVDLEVTGVTAARPGDVRTWLISYYPVHAADGAIGWLGAFLVDITQRKRGAERARLFADLGALLDAAVSTEARMGVLVDALVPDPCAGVAVRLRTASGELVRVASRGTARPQQTIPLVARGRDLGTVELALARTGEPGEDRAFAAELARRTALAVDSAQLLEAERVARERTGVQYAVAAALAEALEPAAVAEVTVAKVIAAVGADHGTMWVLDEEGTELHAVGWQGYTDEEMRDYRVADPREHRPVALALRTRRIVHHATQASMTDAYPLIAAGLLARGLHSLVAFPLITRGRVLGGLLLTADRPHAFTADDLDLGAALGAQAAQALDRARLYEAERRTSVTLQRALLPASLPEVEGVELGLRYLPAAGLEAGGDFYEAVPLADGSLVVAVGDVVGRGPTAAAAMGQLRSALRAFALTGDDPGALLTRLSAFADTITEAMAATAVVAKLDPATGCLVYACAGHPWPVHTVKEGRAELLQGGRGVPLGCLPEPQYREATVDLEPGATVLLYTDGLTERRGEDMDAALERLRAAVGVHAADPLATLLDHAVTDAGAVAPADDVALVALRFTGVRSVRRHAFTAELEQVSVARHAIRDWLSELGVGALPASDVLLAAGEAIANAVEHAGAASVELELAGGVGASPGAIRLVIRDDGRWKDPVVSPHRGRGFGLMRSLMDECAVQRTEGGTVVRLVHHVELAAPAGGPTGPAPSAGAGACTVALDADGCAVLTGELDLACAEAVRRELSVADLSTVDMRGVTHLDSTGARMLFELPSRPIFIAPPGSPPRRTLDVYSLTGVMNVRDA